MRLGVFGGSFDPIHFGHLLVAELCREHCKLDEVLFVPAAVPPHKTHQELAPAKARLEMIELAVAGNEALAVSALEIDRGGPSYTFETLNALHQEDPSRELFLLLGADAWNDLPNWREPARVCEMAWPIAVPRSGCPDPQIDRLASFVSPHRLAEIQRLQVNFPRIDLSSSEIRRRVATGSSIRYQTPRAVEAYIQAHRLYSKT